jgi:hypothetical protein
MMMILQNSGIFISEAIDNRAAVVVAKVSTKQVEQKWMNYATLRRIKKKRISDNQYVVYHLLSFVPQSVGKGFSPQQRSSIGGKLISELLPSLAVDFTALQGFPGLVHDPRGDQILSIHRGHVALVFHQAESPHTAAID